MLGGVMVFSRKLFPQEEKLLDLLAQKSLVKLSPHWKDNLLVIPMNDGGMGSLQLLPDGIKQKNLLFGKCISQYQFTDKDGVEVIVSLNVDDKGELFELDIWKTDFSQLISLPEEY